MQHIEHLAWTPGRDNKKIQKNSTDTRLIVVTLESRMSAMRCLSDAEVRLPLYLSFRHSPQHQLSKNITLLKNPRHLSRRRYSTWYEANQKQRWDLDLDSSRIRFPLTLSYTHITMQPIEHLAEHLAERTQIQKPLMTRLSLPRWGVRCQKWVVCLHAEIRFPLYLSYRHSTQHQVTRLWLTQWRKNLLQDAAMTPCWRRKLEPEFQWHGQLATDSTSRRESKLPCQLYWHKVDPCHAVDSDVRGEMSVFMPKSDSHCIFPIVVLRNTNFWDVNTMKKNPCNRSCRYQSVWHERNFFKKKKNRKQLWDLDIYSGIPFQLTRFYCPNAISINQSFAPLRERLTQCSLRECSPPSSLTSVHHEKIQTISMSHC